MKLVVSEVRKHLVDQLGAEVLLCQAILRCYSRVLDRIVDQKNSSYANASFILILPYDAVIGRAYVAK